MKQPVRWETSDAATTGAAARVFLAAAAVVLAYELLFKHAALVSPHMLLDDIFLFERAIHERAFNDISAFIPAFATVDLDGIAYLDMYRMMFSTLDSIVAARLIHLLFFAMGCGLFAVLLLDVTSDAIFSAGAAIMAFLTPFTPIFTIFVTGSYNVFFFFSLFLSLVILMRLELAAPRPGEVAVYAATILFLLISVGVFRGGALIALVSLIFVFALQKTHHTPSGRRLMATTALIVLPALIYLIATFEHPYRHLEGRMTTDLAGILLNGVSIISTMTGGYVNPMVRTGGLTQTGSYWPAGIFAVSAIALFALAYMQRRRLIAGFAGGRAQVLTMAFLAIALGASIAPYLLLTRTHIWHYVPHMIFLVSASALFLRYVAGRRAAYGMLALLGALTVASYVRQMPDYNVALGDQNFIVAAIEGNKAILADYDEIFFVTDSSYRVAGLAASFRSTSLLRLVTGEADGQRLTLLRDTAKSREIISAALASGEARAFRLTDDGELAPFDAGE